MKRNDFILEMRTVTDLHLEEKTMTHYFGKAAKEKNNPSLAVIQNLIINTKNGYKAHLMLCPGGAEPACTTWRCQGGEEENRKRKKEQGTEEERRRLTTPSPCKCECMSLPHKLCSINCTIE